MNENIAYLLDQFLEIFKEDATVLEFQRVQKIILKDSKLLEMIKTLQKEQKGSLRYLELKHQLFEQEVYQKYLRLEQELTYWTYQMSDALKQIARKNKI